MPPFLGRGGRGELKAMTKGKEGAEENGKAVEPIKAPDGSSSSAQRNLQVVLTTLAAKTADKML